MTNLNVRDVLNAASAVINTPTKSIRDVLGIEDFDAFDVGLLSFSPALFLGRQAFKWFQGTKKQDQEKERMYREIIRKQQAAIAKQREINRELEKRERHHSSEGINQKKQIEELQKQVENLEEVINKLEELKERAA